MDRKSWLEETLRAALQPQHLEVYDDSARHKGHVGAAGGGGHFRVVIVSEAFRDQTPVARQRAVYAVLGDAMHSTIHALAMRTLTPEEWREGADASRRER